MRSICLSVVQHLIAWMPHANVLGCQVSEKVLQAVDRWKVWIQRCDCTQASLSRHSFGKGQHSYTVKSFYPPQTASSRQFPCLSMRRPFRKPSAALVPFVVRWSSLMPHLCLSRCAVELNQAVFRRSTHAVFAIFGPDAGNAADLFFQASVMFLVHRRPRLSCLAAVQDKTTITLGPRSG